jgi:hypothetical protein
VAEFDPSVPSIARVYDYFLGGKDNFASDRALADRMIEIAPLAPVITRENRQFLARAVRPVHRPRLRPADVTGHA